MSVDGVGVEETIIMSWNLAVIGEMVDVDVRRIF